eukprot:16428727-Heterocapsa_arctica.AAC.1
MRTRTGGPARPGGPRQAGASSCVERYWRRGRARRRRSLCLPQRQNYSPWEWRSKKGRSSSTSWTR